MPAKSIHKRTVTVDLSKLKEHLLEISKKNGGLESSGGYGPDELDHAWDGMKSMFSGEFKEVGDLISDIVSDLCEAHYTHAHGEGEEDDGEEDQSSVEARQEDDDE